MQVMFFPACDMRVSAWQVAYVSDHAVMSFVLGKQKLQEWGFVPLGGRIKRRVSQKLLRSTAISTDACRIIFC